MDQNKVRKLLNHCIAMSLDGSMQELIIMLKSSSFCTVTAEDKSALLEAAKISPQQMIYRLLEIPAIQDLVTANDNYSLISAAEMGQLAVVNSLLEVRAVRAQVTANNNKALLIAVENENSLVVNRLLDIPEVQDKVTANNNEVLLRIAQKGLLSLLNRILEMPGVKELADVDNNHALIEAAYHNHPEVFHRLLELKNVQNRAAAALVCAARNGSLAMVNSLLMIPGVQVQVTAENNKILDAAALSGNLELINYLLEIPEVLTLADANDNRALQTAAGCGYLSVVNRLLQIPTVYNNASAHKNGALQNALVFNRKDVVDVVDTLLQIPSVANLAVSNDSKVLFTAIGTNNLIILNRVLGIPGMIKRLSADICSHLFEAAKTGQNVFNRLLKIPGIKDLDSDDLIALLYMVSINESTEPMRRLLQIDCVISYVFTFKSENSEKVLKTAYEEVIERFQIFSYDMHDTKHTKQEYQNIIQLFDLVKNDEEVKNNMDVVSFESKLFESYFIHQAEELNEQINQQGLDTDFDRTEEEIMVLCTSRASSFVNRANLTEAKLRLFATCLSTEARLLQHPISREEFDSRKICLVKKLDQLFDDNKAAEISYRLRSLYNHLKEVKPFPVRVYIANANTLSFWNASQKSINHTGTMPNQLAIRVI